MGVTRSTGSETRAAQARRLYENVNWLNIFVWTSLLLLKTYADCW